MRGPLERRTETIAARYQARLSIARTRTRGRRTTEDYKRRLLAK